MFANARLFTDTIRTYAKPVTSFTISLFVVVAALPAFAQQQEAGTHLVGRAVGLAVLVVGVVVVLLALLGVMVIFVWLVRWATRGYPFYGQGLQFQSDGRGHPADILAERFARGEIDKAEFEERRKLLGAR